MDYLAPERQRMAPGGPAQSKGDQGFHPRLKHTDHPGGSTYIPGGTTLNDINFQAVKRLGKDFEVNGNFALEQWKAPIYLPGRQTVTTTTIQLTWFPERKVSF